MRITVSSGYVIINKSINNQKSNEVEKKTSFVNLNKVTKASAYIGLFLVVFSAGFTSGMYKSEISYKIEVLEINRKFDKEKDALMKEIREYEKLPENCKKYLERLEELLEVPISIVSVGPDREQTIFK